MRRRDFIRTASGLMIPLAARSQILNAIAGHQGHALAIYDFIQGSDATVVYDRSGNGNHGVLGSGMTWVSGGVQVNGTSGVSVPDAAVRRAKTFIILTTPHGSGGPGGSAALIGSTTGANPTFLFHEGSGYLQFYNNTIGRPLVRTTSPAVLTGVASVTAGADRLYQNYLYLPTSPAGSSGGSYNVSGAKIALCTAAGNTFVLPSGNVLTWFGMYDSELSVDAIKNIVNSVIAFAATRGVTVPVIPNYTFTGDSRTFGTGGTAWPTLMQPLMPTVADYRNLSFGGATTAAIAALSPATDALYYPTGRRQLLFNWSGINDNALSAADAFTGIANYCSARRAVGWTMVQGTIPVAVSRDTFANALNVLLKANPSAYCDLLVDVAADAHFSGTAYTDTTYYNADQLHLNTTGYQLVAQYFHDNVVAAGFST